MTGITANTYDRMILDAGAVFVGFQDFDNLGTLLGATRGGAKFSIKEKITELQHEGAATEVVGSKRITDVVATLEVKIIEHTIANFKRSIVGSVSESAQILWDAVKRSAQVTDSDYIDNITLVAKVRGNDKLAAIKINNVLSESKFKLSFKHNDEGVLSVTFTGHSEYGDETEPWTIYWPK